MPSGEKPCPCCGLGPNASWSPVWSLCLACGSLANRILLTGRAFPGVGVAESADVVNALGGVASLPGRRVLVVGAGDGSLPPALAAARFEPYLFDPGGPPDGCPPDRFRSAPFFNRFLFATDFGAVVLHGALERSAAWRHLLHECSFALQANGVLSVRSARPSHATPPGDCRQVFSVAGLESTLRQFGFDAVSRRVGDGDQWHLCRRRR